MPKAWMCSCLALGLLLLVPLPARAGLETVTVREHHDSVHGRGLELSFKPLRAESALARLSVEDARAFVAALETEFQAPRSEPCHLARLSVSAVLMGAPCGLAEGARRSGLERRVLAGYEELYGPSPLPLPSALDDSRWFRALKLSPRYMDEGVRAAAMEMLSSPTVAYSMALSLMLYMTAWAVPEPLFSKALASAITVGLLMTYSAAELYTVGQACLSLYREAEAATRRPPPWPRLSLPPGRPGPAGMPRTRGMPKHITSPRTRTTYQMSAAALGRHVSSSSSPVRR